jgi:hypothetical protein
MDAEKPGNKRIERLANDVRAKILAEQEMIARSKGEVTIRIFQRGPGFDIQLITKL